MIAFQLVEFVATWLECIIGILMVSRVVAEKKERQKKVYFAALLIATVAYGINQIQLLSLAASFIGVLGIAIGVRALYKAQIGDCLGGSIAYMILIYMIDFLIISIWANIFGDEQFGAYVTQMYSVGRILCIVLTKSTLLCIYIFLFKRFVHGSYSIKKNLWIAIAALGILVGYFGKNTVNMIGDYLLTIWIFLIALTLTALYSGIQYLNYHNAENQMKLAEERNQMLAENYRNLIQNYRDNQIQSHDLKNHYLVIQGLIREKKFDLLESYIEKIGTVKEGKISGSWTGISTLDLLLEYKRSEAQKKEISFQIIADKIQLRLTEQELVALFGNAIDNAIEACGKLNHSERWIRLSIRNVHNMTFIKITNPSKEIPEIREKRMLSAKEKNKKFGWGMASMQVIVDKYEGTIHGGYKDGIFSLQISFFD